jgi:hypothetical protein
MAFRSHGSRPRRTAEYAANPRTPHTVNQRALIESKLPPLRSFEAATTASALAASIDRAPIQPRNYYNYISETAFLHKFNSGMSLCQEAEKWVLKRGGHRCRFP